MKGEGVGHIVGLDVTLDLAVVGRGAVDRAVHLREVVIPDGRAAVVLENRHGDERVRRQLEGGRRPVERPSGARVADFETVLGPGNAHTGLGVNRKVDGRVRHLALR